MRMVFSREAEVVAEDSPLEEVALWEEADLQVAEVVAQWVAEDRRASSEDSE